MPAFLLTVNGAEVHVRAAEDETLLSVLRDRLHLTGTKYGCGEGECGACTVLIDGVAARSCQATVASAVGGRITTIECLEHNGVLSPVQQAFLDEGAFQCGYCTPGFVNEAQVLLESLAREPVPRAEVEARILTAMDGHICRCTGYVRYYDAIRAAILADPRLTR